MKQTMTEEQQQKDHQQQQQSLAPQPQPAQQARPGSAVSNPRSPIPSSEAELSFHTAGGTTTSERTLVDSSLQRRRLVGSDDEETTLAESVVDSMHSCASTLVGSEETLHEGGHIGSDEEEFLSDHLESASEDIQRYVERLRRDGGGGGSATPPVDDGRGTHPQEDRERLLQALQAPSTEL